MNKLAIIIILLMGSSIVLGQKEESDNPKRKPDSWLEERSSGDDIGHQFKYTVKVYADGRPEVHHGRYQAFRRSGALDYEIWYYLNQQHGLTRMWYEDGKRRSESLFVDGAPHGIQRSWWPNGQLSGESEYLSGRRIGMKKDWYEDGTKESELTYSEDGKSSSAIYWHRNGKKKAEGKFAGPELDQKVGLWKEWDENGKLIVDKYYKDGKEVPEPKDK